MPQQTNTPPPASSTFTVLPQILQTYTCPASVAILILLVGFLLLTLGTQTPEGQGRVLDLKAVSIVRRQGWEVSRLPGKVDNAVAPTTDEVGMRPSLRVVARYFMQRVNLDHHATLAQFFQGSIHGVKGYGRKLLAHILIYNFRSGMVMAVLETIHHRQTLGGHRYATVTQFLNEMFHIVYFII
jgi:hypothetical protein